MSLFKTISARLHGLLQREAVIGDIDEEMRLHLQMVMEENIERGMPPAEARRAALRSFGNLDKNRERAWEVRGGGVIEAFLQDVRYGARLLARHRGFTMVAVLTLALGIGANTAIFSVVNELLLRPLPYPGAERLAILWEFSQGGQRQHLVSRANFRSWREQSTVFEGMAAFSDQRLSLTGGGEPEEVSVQYASPELFRILRVEPLLGRGMTKEDALSGAPKVAVLSHGFWQRRLGGDRQAVGKPITLNGEPFTVVGVLPGGFQWHLKARSGTGRPAEIWTALDMPTEGDAATRGRFLSVVARLKPGVSFAQAEAEMKAVSARLELDEPEHNRGLGVQIVPLREQFVGKVRPALLILLGAVCVVLLIACANVANLLLSRAVAREREIVLRTAIGARRIRVVRQLLTESLLLAGVGSLLGLAFGWWGIRALAAISPSDLIDLQGVGLDLPVLALTLAVSLVTGIVFGLAPALEATRLNLNDALKEGGKGAGGHGTQSRRLRSALVISEVALALVLLASAGLLVKSFVRLQEVDAGFKTENVLTMVVRLPDTTASKYSEAAQIVGFFREATERIGALPGVRSAGMVDFLPLYGGPGASTDFTVDGRPAPPPGQGLGTNVRVADPGYFSTMGIPVLRGRNFTGFEAAEARRVVLISESMARRHFPGEDPIGKRISVEMFEEPVLTEIVGIVGDVRYDSLVDEAEPTVYFPLPELLSSPWRTLVIRTEGDPAEMAPAVRRALREIDPNQPVSDVRTMDQVMAATVGRARFNTLLLGLFAGLATLLAAVGIFGVMNHSVTLRTREIGLRMALGAQPREVLRLILKQGFLLTSIGVVIGLAGALTLTRVMSGLLFGVGSTDPATFAAIVLLLTLVSLIACYIPARRATRVDPLTALRYD
jgi:putative ABC transport system permease protein